MEVYKEDGPGPGLELRPGALETEGQSKAQGSQSQYKGFSPWGGTNVEAHMGHQENI